MDINSVDFIGTQKRLEEISFACFLPCWVIIIGVGSVITMLAIGQGSKQSIQKEIGKMGLEYAHDKPWLFPSGSAREEQALPSL